MSFIADKQTLEDLNLVNKYKADSVFNVFNKVHTAGGEKLLEHMFFHPLSTPEEISQRSRIFSYFQNKGLEFPFDAEAVSLAENYLENTAGANVVATGFGILKKQVSAAVLHDKQYADFREGLHATRKLLNAFRRFISLVEADSADHPFSDLRRIVHLFKDDKLSGLAGENLETSSFIQLTRYDHLLRHTLRQELHQVLEIMYALDVYIAVGKVAAEGDFCYAVPMAREHNLVTMEQVRHPALKNAVDNSLSFDGDSNVVFLTGANMAGKSTLMKTVGISIYLAHMGFPVAAKKMVFSVKDGIYSSINVADNLDLGHSHFYAEVLRVKRVAEELNRGQDMIVIFDELFKGTNVKDAYDATLAITSAFAGYRKCFFILSTHIIEVGAALKESKSVRFSYLPTVMDGPVPTYPYKLEQGITTDRQGMIIIENEGILDLLNSV